jgi:hypothetical protein
MDHAHLQNREEPGMASVLGNGSGNELVGDRASSKCEVCSSDRLTDSVCRHSCSFHDMWTPTFL